ncbi:MAG TPA: hypothetical protein VLW75_11905 [Rhizomicrobium sp.]|nr:hypothetical protein [Rhizomicrobium sp.]
MKHLSLALVFVSFSYCAQAADVPAANAPSSTPAANGADANKSPGDGDVSASLGFEPGKSTVSDVEDKYGKSTMQTHAPDGRHTELFTANNGQLVVVFLFDKDDRLIRTVAYAHQ